MLCSSRKYFIPTCISFGVYYILEIMVRTTICNIYNFATKTTLDQHPCTRGGDMRVILAIGVYVSIVTVS